MCTTATGASALTEMPGRIDPRRPGQASPTRARNAPIERSPPASARQYRNRVRAPLPERCGHSDAPAGIWSDDSRRCIAPVVAPAPAIRRGALSSALGFNQQPVSRHCHGGVGARTRGRRRHGRVADRTACTPNVRSVLSPPVGPEERFTQLRMSAACAHLSRQQVTELVALTADLIEERKRIRRVLERLPEHFTEVRQLLNELARSVR